MRLCCLSSFKGKLIKLLGSYLKNVYLLILRSSFFVLFMFGLVLGRFLAITASSWFVV